MAPQISRLFEAFRAQPDPSAGPATPPAPPAPVAAAVRLPAMPVPPDAQKLRPNAGRPPGAKRPRADLPPVFAPDRAIPAPPDTPRSGPRPSQRVEMDADTIGWLLGPTFTEQVLSGELGAIESSDAQRQVACFLSNGWLLLSKHDPLNVHAMQLKADILRGRHVITREFLVDLEVIRKVYKRSDEGFGGDARSPAQIAGVETQEFQREFLALVKEAARRRCSDIHITVERFEATIRVRADGQMETLRQVPSEWASMLCASAFNMADASDSAYRPLDYQGARISNIRTPLPESIQAIRLQFNPLPNGGRYMICRLLYESSAAQSEGDIDTLGYSASHIVQIKRMRKKPFGINIISGPTGSGKSTTLQRALSTLMREKRGINVITIEDPPEYVIKGAAQLPVLNAQTDEERNEKFRQAISASLRSDPDVIMIGEIRDRASSSLAFAAAMTGHQVWASLHANDAISITDRLRDQQVEDYTLSDPSLVTGMIGQRLIRRLTLHFAENLETAR